MAPPKIEMLNKFRGCILGGAMGDSLGYPVEFYNVSFIKNHKLLKEPYNISLFSDDPKKSSIRSSIEVVMARKK